MEHRPTGVTLKKASINIEEVFNTIKAKGARLNLVLSDCCNTFIKKRRDEIIDTVDRDRGDKEINVRVAMSLFMKAKASMLVSAAMKGQKAKGSVSYNGFFTTSFLESLGLGLMSSGFRSSMEEYHRRNRRGYNEAGYRIQNNTKYYLQSL